MTADVRNFYVHKITAMSVRRTMYHLYPRLLALHDLNDTIALPRALGRVDLPSLMRDSHLFMESHGVYLIGERETRQDGVSVLSFARRQRGSYDPVDWCERLATIAERPPGRRRCYPSRPATGTFSILRTSHSDVLDKVSQLYLPHLPTRLSTQVRNILAHRFAQRGYTPKLYIARQNMDGIEIEFSDMLVEDQNNAAMSYLDCTSPRCVLCGFVLIVYWIDLCLVHKQIHSAVSVALSSHDHLL